MDCFLPVPSAGPEGKLIRARSLFSSRLTSMTMNSSDPQTPAEGSGTASARPARKVQWANTEAGDIREQREERQAEAAHAHAHLLDEHGLDVRIFHFNQSINPTQTLFYCLQPRAFRELQMRLSASGFDNRGDGTSSRLSGDSSLVTTPGTEGPDFDWQWSSSANSPSASRSPTHQMLHTYVDPDEKDGLPSSKSHIGSDNLEEAFETQAGREARRIIKRNKSGLFTKFIRRKQRDPERSKHQVHSDDEKELPERLVDVDLERKAQRAIPPLQINGAGVLSSLLTLYNDRRSPNSGSSTPGTADPSSTGNSQSRNSSPGRSTPLYTASKFGKELKHLIPESRVHRPKSAKSAGGVVGSLIASAGNLTGSATPAGSTIAPDVKRPGWHLNRYELRRRFLLVL
jgi:hypothetical protein